MAMAARDGRGEVLNLFEERGLSIDLHGVDKLLAACARNDSEGVRSIASREPELIRQILAQGGGLLGEFAGIGNTDGVRHLLDLGVDVRAVDTEGNGYWDIAKGSMALHVAAWRARHATLKLLIERGAPVDVPDGKGRTPLVLAVRACVDSYWMDRRSPESVPRCRRGASTSGVDLPTGYATLTSCCANARLRRSNQPSVRRCDGEGRMLRARSVCSRSSVFVRTSAAGLSVTPRMAPGPLERGRRPSGAVAVAEPDE